MAATAVEADAGGCKIAYHWRSVRDGQTTRDSDYWFGLNAVREVVVRSGDEHLKKVNEMCIRDRVQPAPQPTYTPRGPSANSAIQPEAQPNSRPVPQPEARRSVQPQSQSVQQSAPRPAAQPAGQAAPQPSSARSPGKSVYTLSLIHI